MEVTIRPARIAIAVVVFMLIFYAAIAAYHPVRVWLARDTWCVVFMADGNQQIHYGAEACEVDAELPAAQLL